MNGSQVQSAAYVSGAGPDWHVVGTGDFNGDGKATSCGGTTMANSINGR